MNTPAHAVLNLLILGGRPASGRGLAVLAGAFVPDLPIIGFYAYQNMSGASERVIWGERYYQASWQVFFDIFNSIPLILLLLVAALMLSRSLPAYFAASLGLHSIFDFLLHHQDSHRHFFPFSDWRFHSPVSYWDPRFFGDIVSSLEALLAVGGVLYIFFLSKDKPDRAVTAALLAVYAGFRLFATITWG